MRKISLMLAAVVCAACATAKVGKSFDTTHIKDIEHKKTSRAQIDEWFGKPTKKEKPTEPDLIKLGATLQYFYIDAEGKSSGAAKAKVLFVVFDADDIVLTHGYSENDNR